MAALTVDDLMNILGGGGTMRVLLYCEFWARSGRGQLAELTAGREAGIPPEALEAARATLAEIERLRTRLASEGRGDLSVEEVVQLVVDL